MGILYKSKRVGKNGRIFVMYKLKTLKDGAGNSEFAGQDSYTRFGRFFRKYKIDELPSLINVLKGEMVIFGYRPEEKRTVDIWSQSMKDVLLQYKPGIIDLASLHFMDEERLLQLSNDPNETYWSKIRPIKFALQAFYLENKSWLLNIAIITIFMKKIIKAIWSKY